MDTKYVYLDNIIATTRNRKDLWNIPRVLTSSYTRETLVYRYYLRNYLRPRLPSRPSSLDHIAIPEDRRIS
jgi:hypothetical protein